MLESWSAMDVEGREALRVRRGVFRRRYFSSQRIDTEKVAQQLSSHPIHIYITI